MPRPLGIVKAMLAMSMYGRSGSLTRRCHPHESFLNSFLEPQEILHVEEDEITAVPVQGFVKSSLVACLSVSVCDMFRPTCDVSS